MKKNWIWIAFIAMWSPNLAAAAIIERDWQSPGDGLLTYDDVNQRVWLDVPVSLMSQFSGTSLEDRFQNSLVELQPGGMFEGFTLAQTIDVIGLAESAGIDSGTLNYGINEIPTANVVDLLGSTLVLSGGRVSTTGLLEDVLLPPPMSCPCHKIASVGINPETSVAGINIFSSANLLGIDDQGISFTGLFLYRQIPEPSTAVQAILGLLILLGGQSRPRHHWR